MLQRYCILFSDEVGRDATLASKPLTYPSLVRLYLDAAEDCQCVEHAAILCAISHLFTMIYQVVFPCPNV